jgi:hypothetical protein
MFELLEPVRVAALTHGLQAVSHELTTPSLASSSDAQLIDLLRDAEVARRQLASFDQVLIAEIVQRGLAPQFGFSSVRALLRGVLRVSPGEASSRVKAAAVLGPRQALNGEALEPVFPHTAAAQAEGFVSAGHARVVIDTLERIPTSVVTENPDIPDRIETELVAAAASYDPTTLARLGRRYLDHLDPDGTLADDAHVARLRDLTVTLRPNGSSSIRGDADAELTERLLVVFDSLGAPAAMDGVKDDRAPGARRHDALRAALRIIGGTGALPDAGGMPAVVLLTASVDQWNCETGLVTTGHGAAISVPTAKRIAGTEAGFVPVVLGPAREVSAYGTAHRIYSKRQRFAIMARDKGCTWPGCDAPPAWCEINHVVPWKDGGTTSVANGAAMCDRDHDDLDHNGWVATMIDGIPYYIPPPWIDPDQVPRRNTLHDV